MPNLVEPLKRYKVTKLPHTCSMFEIGNFSDQHSHCEATYKNSTFLPPSPAGLYCATFIRDDKSSDIAFDIISRSMKLQYKTLWKKSLGSGDFLRFCVFSCKKKEK